MLLSLVKMELYFQTAQSFSSNSCLGMFKSPRDKMEPNVHVSVLEPLNATFCKSASQTQKEFI